MKNIDTTTFKENGCSRDTATAKPFTLRAPHAVQFTINEKWKVKWNSHQFQIFPCSLTRNITPHSMKNVGFIAYSDERWLYNFSSYTNSHTSAERFWECILILSLRVKGLKQLVILRSVQPIKWMTSRWLETALESKEGSSLEKTKLSTSLGYVLCAPNHDDSEQPVLFSVQQFDWLREHDLEDARKPAVLPSYSECPLWKFEQFAPIFFERRFERATSHRHNLRQPRRSVGDASCHVHSPAVQASALLSGDDRPRSRFSCPASVRRVSLSSGSSSEPCAVFTLQVIQCHCVHIRLRLAFNVSSDLPGPIRCSVLLPQVSTDCDGQASLCSARLHMDSCHALGRYIPAGHQIVGCRRY